MKPALIVILVAVFVLALAAPALADECDYERDYDLPGEGSIDVCYDGDDHEFELTVTNPQDDEVFEGTMPSN